MVPCALLVVLCALYTPGMGMTVGVGKTERSSTLLSAVDEVIDRLLDAFGNQRQDVWNLISLVSALVKPLADNKESLTDLQTELKDSMTDLKTELKDSMAELKDSLTDLKDSQRNQETTLQNQLNNISTTLGIVMSNMSNVRPYTCVDVRSDEPRHQVVLASGMRVLCDTVTDGGGWLVFQRRINGKTDFFRNWAEYKSGFGSLDGDFWLGNDKIHQLTSQRPHEMRVDFVYKKKSYYARYATFSISDEADKYRLKIGKYSGNAGDHLSYHHNNMKFTTFDQDNDDWHKNCAKDNNHGAWWYGSCHNSDLNGVWGSKRKGKGIHWKSVTGYSDSAEFTEMKIRPV